MHPTSLRCEYMENPLGVGERQPRLSWRWEEGRRGAAQRAYRILVASSLAILGQHRGDLWDSGLVESGETVNIPYAGATLASRQRSYWKVCGVDERGELTPWSAPAWWEMGLLEAEAWEGQWISYAPNETHLNPRPAYYFRRVFAPRADPVRARAYVTARGVYELWVNGERAGVEAFSPGWTDYRRRLYVQSFDLDAKLVAGENAIGLVLGEGWYCGRLGWAGNRHQYGDRPEIYCQVELTYADGSRETIVSDGEWTCAKGPILSSGFLLGESYDARREMPGWSGAGFDDTGWGTPHVAPCDGVSFEHACYPPVRPMQELAAQTIQQLDDDLYVIDLGQNMVGRARLRVSGPAGTQVTLRYGEMVYPDGQLYTANLRSANSTDVYKLRGEGEEVYEPAFTFHGFRYVEVRGLPAPPTNDTITGIVLHSAAEETGSFACSHPLVTRLHQNIVWGQRGNFLEVPTDCPQRDERLGWMGDGQVFARTACYNMDLAAFYAKWMTDINDAQGANGAFSHLAPDIMPKSEAEEIARHFSWDNSHHGMAAWGDAGVIVPWVHYLFYGDTRLVARCYPHMTAWADYLLGRSTGLLSPADGFGDWLSIDADTPKALLATAYFAHVTELVSRMAAALGRTEDATRYRARFEEIRAAFTRAFVAADGRLAGETQTGYLLALHFDLLPVELRAPAAAHLVADLRARGLHTSCGFIGIGYLQPVLTALGYEEVAYALLEQESYPSWLYSVRQGATTIWERWDGWRHDRGFQDPNMNSFNHYSLGSVGEWLFATVAGIAPDASRPGFAHVRIRPRPGGSLTWAEATYRSHHGAIHTRWERTAESLSLTLTLPATCTATVCLPAARAGQVRESGVPVREAEGVSAVRESDGEVVCEVEAGQYAFRVTPN
jgi:alpha-L-rhamnosidase